MLDTPSLGINRMAVRGRPVPDSPDRFHHTDPTPPQAGRARQMPGPFFVPRESPGERPRFTGRTDKTLLLLGLSHIWANCRRRTRKAPNLSELAGDTRDSPP